MESHLENLENILSYILDETPPEKMVTILYDRLQHITDRLLILRDTENFIAYARFVISTMDGTKENTFSPQLIEKFINLTYVGYSNQKHRTERLYLYLKSFLENYHFLDEQTLTALQQHIEYEKQPTLYRVMERARIAIILKWMQGPLQNRLSPQFKDYVLFLATVYGQFRTQKIFAIDWQQLDVPEQDMELIIQEYVVFENALRKAIQTIRKSKWKEPPSTQYPAQCYLVFESLENLIKAAKDSSCEPIEIFKNKIIVATALLYFQDDFVKKDAELQRIIQLFVSLYYQFRDRRDIKIPL
jgi:hypothetical protein